MKFGWILDETLKKLRWTLKEHGWSLYETWMKLGWNLDEILMKDRSKYWD